MYTPVLSKSDLRSTLALYMTMFILPNIIAWVGLYLLGPSTAKEIIGQPFPQALTALVVSANLIMALIVYVCLITMAQWMHEDCLDYFARLTLGWSGSTFRIVWLLVQVAITILAAVVANIVMASIGF